MIYPDDDSDPVVLDYTSDALGTEVLDAEFTPLLTPEVSDDLLGTDELDHILDSIDLEDEVDLGALFD